MMDFTENALVSLLKQGATGADWILVLDVSNDNVIVLRNIMIANCSGHSSQFGLMICPNTYTPVSGIDQNNTVFKVNIAADESYNQSLNAAVPSGYAVYVWGADPDINYHISGIVGQR